VLPEFSMGAAQISSTHIRSALSAGDVRTANLLLGRPFSVPARTDGARGLCASVLHWLPAPGTYPVLVEGHPGSVTITDSPCAFEMRDALDSEICQACEVNVEFV